MNTIQTKTIQLQLENFKKRVITWVRKKNFQLDVNEWATANEIVTKYKKSATTLLVENDENDYDFVQAMNEIIEDVEKAPSKVSNIVEEIFRYTQMEDMVCHFEILQLIFPNLEGELSVKYTIPMYMNQK